MYLELISLHETIKDFMIQVLNKFKHSNKELIVFEKKN